MMKSDLREVAKKILGDKFDKLDDNMKEYVTDKLGDFERDFDSEVARSLDRLKDDLKDLDVDGVFDKNGEITKTALENIYKSYNG